MALTVFHWLLALGMLVTGSVNTLSTKAADNQCSVNKNGWNVNFNHPFVQAAGMFIGEFLCLIVYSALSFRARSSGDDAFQRAKPHSRLIYALPAICDMTATSVMYIGLSLTASSVFQMLRGSVIVFTSILSVIFLKRKLGAHHYLGILLVVGGTAVVGTDSLVPQCASGDSSSATGGKAMLGNILIIVAQIIVAVQMVVEEKLLSKYEIPPLQVVGWEGFFGFTILSSALVGLYFVKPPSDFCTTPACNNVIPAGVPQPYTCDHFEDTPDAFTQIANSPAVAGFLSLNILSIAFFNAFGVAITKHVNAATRMVMDSLRTMVIWGFSLGIGWESFCYVQLIGFALLLTGTLVYNEVVKIPGLKYASKDAQLEADDDKAGLLQYESGGLFTGDDYALLSADSSLNGPAYPVRGIKGVRK